MSLLKWFFGNNPWTMSSVLEPIFITLRECALSSGGSEGVYEVLYPAQAVIRNQQVSLLNALASASGTKLGEPITVEGSFNPGGVYSDRAGGIQIHEYTLP
jgi:hypothetical protein